MTFYRCEHCGNIIVHFNDSGVRCVCCGEEMKALEPNSSGAAAEKHTPVISVSGKTVSVKISQAEHPMQEAHYIQWIAIETKQGWQKKELKPGEKPEAEFVLSGADELVAAYEYCNLHGLWKAEA